MRYTVELGQDAEQNLERLAKEKRLTKAEVIRRAIASYEYLMSETSGKQNRRVSITEDNHVVKDVVLP